MRDKPHVQGSPSSRVGPGLVFLGLAASLVVGFLWWSAGHKQGVPAERIAFTDLNPYGANFFLDREVEAWKREKTLAMAQEAGVRWIKQQFSWEEIEPLRKGEFDWAKYDLIVDLADQFGMEIIARLDRPPAWARQGSPFRAGPPDDLEDFGDFVSEFVSRYGERVHFVQIWNEPNLTAEWGFERVDAVAYTRMLEVAYRRAKEANPNVVVLSAPLAITLEDASMRGNHNDLVFLEEMYKAGAAGFFDILSANAFGLDRPPEDPPDAKVLNFRRVELQRAIMERYGDGGKPVWINEYGWNAAPASFEDELLTWERVTETQQAEYTVRGISWAREHWPWLGVVNIWYFRQVGDILPDRPAYYFAMVDPEFNPNAVYAAIREAASAERRNSAGLGLHEDTSLAVSAPGWHLVVDVEASGGTALSSGATAGPLTFRFDGSQLALVTALGPGQGRLFVEIDGQAPEGLPTDAGGRAFVELQAQHPARQATVVLARDLEAGAHEAILRPEGPGPVTVDAFLVSDTRSVLPYDILLGVCAGLVLAGAALWYGRHGRRQPARRQADAH